MGGGLLARMFKMEKSFIEYLTSDMQQMWRVLRSSPQAVLSKASWRTSKMMLELHMCKVHFTHLAVMSVLPVFSHWMLRNHQLGIVLHAVTQSAGKASQSHAL